VITGATENEGATSAALTTAVDAAMLTGFGVVPFVAVIMTVTCFVKSVAARVYDALVAPLIAVQPLGTVAPEERPVTALVQSYHW
jgi:hypothetical protein